jgi:hypothetical protein
MRRLFWVALGATAGVLVVRKLTKTAEAYTPQGLARGLNNVAEAIRDFGDAIADGMAEREIELREALGIDEDPTGTNTTGTNTTGTNTRGVR